MFSKKIILTGGFGVGKTSLLNRFFHQKFHNSYLPSIGIKVKKKQLDIDKENLSLDYWDIPGEICQSKVPSSVFFGADVVYYIIDLTRPSTYKNINSQIDIIHNVIPDTPIKIIGNKCDLVKDSVLQQIEKQIHLPFHLLTSAKAGKNITNLFLPTPN